MDGQQKVEAPLPFMVGRANAVGTSLQGELQIPFSRVVEVFGEPQESDGYKVAFEWRIAFADGTVATIYDYKASSLYNDEYPTPEQMREQNFSDWHIGGRTTRAVELVREALTTKVSA